MAQWILYMAWSSDPGAVPMGARPLYHPSYEQPTLPATASDDLESGDESRATNAEGSSATPLSQPLKFCKTESDTDPLNQSLSMLSPIPIVPSASNEIYASAVSPSSQLTASRFIRRCRKCNDNYKPPRAHHDSVTGRCIVKWTITVRGWEMQSGL